ncbi:hypothetical protein [Parashewanella curva]|uniref:hypothetical protein n=1 Tax=Parashewanella curva TaxID=2338552 RepID=UPI001404FF27|nr:hypothetical protein [Parashewanella curva]
MSCTTEAGRGETTIREPQYVFAVSDDLMATKTAEVRGIVKSTKGTDFYEVRKIFSAY